MKLIFAFYIGLLLWSGIAIAAPAIGVPADKSIQFEILRGGKPFGTHDIIFEKNGAQTIANIKIQMRYKLAGLTVFRYDHSNREIWNGNKLLSVLSKTDDDGRKHKVEKNNLKNIFSSSYWNKSMLKAREILNTQYGSIDSIKVTKSGTRKLEIAGKSITADVYKVDTTVPITVMYDQKTKQWVGLSFTARGAEVEYKRKDAL